MSASMYNSPYTYHRENQRRIEYPPFFSGIKISFKHVLDSKFLAIAVLVLFIAFLVVMICTVNPFWFELLLSPGDATFGTMNQVRGLTINSGLYYLRESEMDSLLFLNQFNGRDVVPKPLALAEIFAVVGTCMLMLCFLASFILAVRKFASPAALIILAFCTSVTALSLIGTFVSALILVIMSSCDYYGGGCQYKNNLVWRMIPMYKQMYRVEPHLTPYVKPNWAFYIFVIGCILAVAASVLLWMEALVTYRNISQIRYQQLRQARNPYEADDAPQVKKYVYNPPVVHGSHGYDMQPVMYSSGPYVPPSTKHHSSSSDPYAHAHAPPVSYAPEPKKQRSPPRTRRGPPSETSSTSGAYISREIDL